VGQAVLQVDDGLQRRQEHFELLELFGRIAAELFEVNLFAGLQPFDKIGHTSR
jgi:hypothetical protein